jgi:hypothetical protein
MALRYTMRVEGAVFVVSVAGTVDAESAREAYGRVVRACTDGGHTSMLVDVRQARGELSTLDRFDFGKFVAQQNTEAEGRLGAQLRVALVARPPLADPALFGQLVAANRGASITVTSDMDEALRWIGLEPSEPPPGE